MAQTRKHRTKVSLGAADYLEMPYSRVIIPDEDGTFLAEIIEFPGCIATGNTEAEALGSLKDVALSWLEATLAKGQVIPEPMEIMEFSGKLVLRLPKSLHKKASRAAQRDGTSLNQLIVSSLAEYIGVRSVTAAQPKAHLISIRALDTYHVGSMDSLGLPRQIEIGMSGGSPIFHGEYEEEVVALPRRVNA